MSHRFRRKNFTQLFELLKNFVGKNSNVAEQLLFCSFKQNILYYE